MSGRKMFIVALCILAALAALLILLVPGDGGREVPRQMEMLPAPILEQP